MTSPAAGGRAGLRPLTLAEVLVADLLRAEAALYLAGVLLLARDHPRADPARIAFYTVRLAELLGLDQYAY